MTIAHGGHGDTLWLMLSAVEFLWTTGFIVMTILFITVVMAIIVIIAGPVSGYTSFVIAGELCTGTLGIITVFFITPIVTVVVMVTAPAIRDTGSGFTLEVARRTFQVRTVKFIRSISTIIVSVTKPGSWDTASIGAGEVGVGTVGVNTGVCRHTDAINFHVFFSTLAVFRRPRFPGNLEGISVTGTGAILLGEFGSRAIKLGAGQA